MIGLLCLAPSLITLIYMSQALIQSRLQSHFPTLYKALPEVPASAYQLMQVPIDTTVFNIGGACEQYLLITQGTVGVKMLTKNGKSVLLYRVTQGQSCIITTSCLLGDSHYPSFGETETPVEALGMPHAVFSRAIDESKIFRQFVFDGLGQRLADVMQRLELINFTSIDSRLASALLVRAEQSPLIQVTHEALAEEVGSAREVISRHLKKMEEKELLGLERGSIILKNRDELSKLCE